MVQNLTRNEFKNLVFKRDKHACVVPWCTRQANAAHHIIERGLWPASDTYPNGYILDNGVSLCAAHHIDAENDRFPPQACRLWAGITQRILPEHFDQDFWFTKWGKSIKTPTRIKCKYPSTPYLNFSPGGDHDFNIPSKCLLNKPLVVTVKMDGANAVVRDDGSIAGRNGDSAGHPQYNLLKANAYNLSQNIPEGVQVFGEWLYAKHSIHYQNLPAYLQIFAAYSYNDQLWLSWDDVEAIAFDMGVPTVPVIGNIRCSAEWELVSALIGMAGETIDSGHEGLVVRSRYPFHYGQFSSNIAKYVRIGHVQDDEKHWSKRSITRNTLVQ